MMLEKRSAVTHDPDGGIIHLSPLGRSAITIAANNGTIRSTPPIKNIMNAGKIRTGTSAIKLMERANL
jgi:hypothetical protein